MTGFEISVRAKSREGRDKLSAELMWLLHKAESGNEKQLKKLHNWLMAHKNQVKFKVLDDDVSVDEFYDIFYEMAQKGISGSQMVMSEVRVSEKDKA